jgi:hypothetical protein
MLFVTTPGKNICYIALVRITSGYQWPVGGIIIEGIKLALGVNDRSHIGFS